MLTKTALATRISLVNYTANLILKIHVYFRSEACIYLSNLFDLGNIKINEVVPRMRCFAVIPGKSRLWQHLQMNFFIFESLKSGYLKMRSERKMPFYTKLQHLSKGHLA